VNLAITSLQAIADFADVLIQVEVELGRKIMTIAQILELEPGSVIRMARLAGGDLDVLVGGSLIACGEVVIIEDSVAVRITDFRMTE
jgi:flagellar motor switch protein FliN/FliY